MKIISFIYERKVIKEILDHLGLFEKSKPQRKRGPPQLPAISVETITEPYDDGCPDYEEPFIDVKTL
jgi:hypothetical protein